MNGWKWLGTLTGIAGGVMVALNFSLSGWGFVLLVVNTVCWAVIAHKMGERSLFVLQLGLTAINLLGVYRWLL